MPKIRGRIPITSLVIRNSPLKKTAPKRKRPSPPPINLAQKDVPPTNRRLVGDTLFLADSWRGLLGRSQEWLPRAAFEKRR